MEYKCDGCRTWTAARRIRVSFSGLRFCPPCWQTVWAK